MALAMATRSDTDASNCVRTRMSGGSWPRVSTSIDAACLTGALYFLSLLGNEGEEAFYEKGSL